MGGTAPLAVGLHLAHDVDGLVVGRVDMGVGVREEVRPGEPLEDGPVVLVCTEHSLRWDSVGWC